MLYPFSLTLDLYIQAESFEEAKKLAEAYVQDASLDTTDYPEIVQDVLEVAEDGTKNGWDEDRVGLESSEFDYYEVEYPTVEENKGATIFISHLDSCLGWDNEEEEK